MSALIAVLSFLVMLALIPILLVQPLVMRVRWAAGLQPQDRHNAHHALLDTTVTSPEPSHAYRVAEERMLRYQNNNSAQRLVPEHKMDQQRQRDLHVAC